MKLLIQPDHGIRPLLDALRRAKKSIRILIFRFDRSEIEKALVAAAARGVAVQALIAHTNHGEERNLRQLEMRLLGQGITVARTADDLVRYHGKMIIIDDRLLYVLGFNFTHMDIDLSRSLGVAISRPDLVKEAIRLFECDSPRRRYKGPRGDLIVSPINARERLTRFIAGAKKRLLMYEMKISDREFLKLLNKKIAEGVEVRILSRASTKNGSMPVRRMPARLHLRAILRDGNAAFLGSQSLSRLELEVRREIGVIFRDKKVLAQMEAIFEKDWKQSEPMISTDTTAAALEIPAKKIAREVAKKISIKPVMVEMLDKMIDTKNGTPFEPEEVAETVRDAFRDEVQGAVTNALQDMVAKSAEKDEEREPVGQAK